MERDLFTVAGERNTALQPLAERFRPRTLDEVVGQPKLLGKDKPLRRLIESGRLPSMLLWGPPGCGKTTLARLLAHVLSYEYETMSAVMGGVKDLRTIVERAQMRRNMQGRRTLLFIDEIHRFNKAQQDALLPHVESGVLTFVGATTENPSFEVNGALLSRCRVYVLEPLAAEEIATLIERVLADNERGLGAQQLTLETTALQAIVQWSQGDARRALGTLEVAAQLAASQHETVITVTMAEQAAQHKALIYDKSGEEHYNVVSAFIKSMRGSDADAAVYWMTRMLEAGEAPRFILRRLVIFASEDIGNADPRALQVAVSALQAFELVGLPEGVLPLTQAVTYLACAPKSNAVLTAYSAARKDVQQFGSLAVPAKLRNAPTSLMKQMGYGKDYKYPHHFAGHYVEEEYLPEQLQGRRYYIRSGQGEES